MTYVILRAYTGIGVSHSQREKIARGFGKNAGEWTGRVEISKEEIPGSKHSMYGYILTYSRLYGVVPKGLLTFPGSLYREGVKTTSGLWYTTSRDKPPENLFFLPKTL